MELCETTVAENNWTDSLLNVWIINILSLTTFSFNLSLEKFGWGVEGIQKNGILKRITFSLRKLINEKYKSTRLIFPNHTLNNHYYPCPIFEKSTK